MVENSVVIEKIIVEGFPERAEGPVDELEFLSDHQKDFFHKTYRAHKDFLRNKHNGYVEDFFEAAKAYLYVCLLDEGLLKIPFVQKYAEFYGLIPDEFGLYHLYDGRYECSHCGAVLHSHKKCPVCN